MSPESTDLVRSVFIMGRRLNDQSGMAEATYHDEDRGKGWSKPWAASWGDGTVNVHGYGATRAAAMRDLIEAMRVILNTAEAA